MISSLRIIVAGMVGLYPVGGVAWDYLQYVIGLAQLGHDVYYHEDTWCWPYHPNRNQYIPEGDYSAQYIRDFFKAYAPELQDRWHYKHLHGKSFGMAANQFDNVARTADLFLNVSGSCIIPECLPATCVKVFVDTDPGYNQIVLSEKPVWSENVERWCALVRNHDRHFTYAENMHNPDCRIPKLDLCWKTTRMPVVTDLWSPIAGLQPPAGKPWTTIMTWNAFKGKLVYEGAEYKSKDREFVKLIDLPRYTKLRLKAAVGGVNAPLELLGKHGWNIVDGPKVTQNPDQYQDFIANSRGEISTAKQVYVAMRSGWFSCRSACYLAAGRPVVVQDTGYSATLPIGKGILPFANLEEAVAALAEAEGNYASHARAAASIAHEHFHSKIVLTRLIEEAMDSH
jgi:hypothetical protein